MILKWKLRERISVRLSQIVHQRFSTGLHQILAGALALSFSRNFEERSLASISCDGSTRSTDRNGSDNSTLTVDCRRCICSPANAYENKAK